MSKNVRLAISDSFAISKLTASCMSFIALNVLETFFRAEISCPRFLTLPLCFDLRRTSHPHNSSCALAILNSLALGRLSWLLLRPKEFATHLNRAYVPHTPMSPSLTPLNTCLSTHTNLFLAYTAREGAFADRIEFNRIDRKLWHWQGGVHVPS